MRTSDLRTAKRSLDGDEHSLPRRRPIDSRRSFLKLRVQDGEVVAEEAIAEFRRVLAEAE